MKNRPIQHPPYDKFRGFMAEHRLHAGDIAELLGVSKTIVYYKINGRSDFTLQEFIKLYEIGAKPEFFII